MASSIEIGNLNVDSVEFNSSIINLHNWLQVVPTLKTGNEYILVPTGSFTETGLCEFTLSGVFS